jgi:LAO/AO transport system kinase
VTVARTLADRVLGAEPVAIARALTCVERRSEGVDELLADLHRHTRGAHVLGVTGPPGSGKSTLVTCLTAEYRRRGRTVGVIAVDPSSVLTGGAILGDRIRMTELAGDPGVFIRSIATRGALGGLSRAALDAITVLDAAGKDIVVLETVGVGQAEVDVLSAAQTVAVVSVPGMGDDVQAIKAGLLEIADVHVVNKADREGAHKTVSELREVLKMSPRTPDGWDVPIRQTVAATGDGVARLADMFDEHRAWLDRSGHRDVRERRNAATRIRWMAEEVVLRRLHTGFPPFDAAVDAVVARRSDPAEAARELVQALALNPLGRPTPDIQE